MPPEAINFTADGIAESVNHAGRNYHNRQTEGNGDARNHNNKTREGPGLIANNTPGYIKWKSHAL